MAGKSAQAVARRQREKAAKLERSAELWQRGADGERATAATLETLPSRYWTVLHDVAWPGRPRANIDHVAVGPPGVFVIDSKNWSGSITLRSGVLRQSGRSRASAVEGVHDAAHAVARMLDPTGSAVTQGILCLTGETHASGTAGQVIICSVSDLPQYLTSLSPRIHEVSLPGLAEHVKSRLSAYGQRPPLRPGAAGPILSGSTIGGSLSSELRPAAPPTPVRSARSRSAAPPKLRPFKVPWLSLVKPALGVAFLTVVFTQPQVITGVTTGIANIVVTQLVPDVPPVPPEAEPSTTPEPREDARKERRREKREQRQGG